MKFIPHVSALAVAGLSLWSTPSTVRAQETTRSVLRQLYGDLAFEVRTKGQGTLNVGAADSRTTVVLTLMAVDLRRWSDSVTRVLDARAPRRGQSASWNAVVAGPGNVAGSMALTRSIAPGDTTIILLVTDTAFHGVRTPLSTYEARALASAMKRAANASMPTRVPPMKAAPKATPPPKKPPGSGSDSKLRG